MAKKVEQFVIAECNKALEAEDLVDGDIYFSLGTATDMANEYMDSDQASGSFFIFKLVPVRQVVRASTQIIDL